MMPRARGDNPIGPLLLLIGLLLYVIANCTLEEAETTPLSTPTVIQVAAVETPTVIVPATSTVVTLLVPSIDHAASATPSPTRSPMPTWTPTQPPTATAIATAALPPVLPRAGGEAP